MATLRMSVRVNGYTGLGQGLLGTIRRLGFAGLASGIVAAFLLTLTVSAEAGYSDGMRAWKSKNYADAVRIWRRAAWLEDDLLSQMELGRVYSRSPEAIRTASASDFIQRDLIEAYVWYFLASVNTNALGLSEEADKEYEYRRSVALVKRAELFLPMVPGERNEAHNRIVYILASRGVQGYFRLGELYDGRISLGVVSDTNAEPVAQSTDLPALFPGSGGDVDSASLTDSGGDVDVSALSTELVILSGLPRNNAEAVAYYQLSSDPAIGNFHPLAPVMVERLVEHLESEFSGNPGYVNLVLEAAKKRRARLVLPFEVYPGGHSDERVGDSTRAEALIMAEEELELRFVQHALRSLGYYTRAVDNQPGPGTTRAVKIFQASINVRETGELTPQQTVRLIQEAANRGHAISQNTLGTMYFKGIGEPKNCVRALEWFRTAADQRHPFALYNLGLLYGYGENKDDGFGAGGCVQTDVTQAVSFLLAAKAACYGSVSRELKELGWD
ncbi:MAG: peptidoglycan-binding protein [Pseudomonadota bacterium]